MQDSFNAYDKHRAQYIEQCSKRLFMEKIVNKLASDQTLEINDNEEIAEAVATHFEQSGDRFLQSVNILKSLSEEYQKGNIFI